MTDPVHKPLKPNTARRIAREIAENGVVVFGKHARDEMEKDDLVDADCLNLIRGGAYGGAELINDEWRYTIETGRMATVITFLSTTELRVVTAWRK